MGIFRKRFSSEELLQILVSCSFPVHVWAIPNMLRDVPSWSYYLSTNDILGAVAYSLVFMLVESLIVFIVFAIIGMLLPKRLTIDSFVPFSFVLLLEFAVLAIAFQYIYLEYINIRRIYLIGVVLLVFASAFILIRSRSVRNLSLTIINRLTPLALIYLFFDLLAVIIVIIRIL